MYSLKIGSIEISENSPKVFVIAEIGNNHNGSFDRAIEMIDEAISTGADCVKFQMRDLGSVYRKKSLEKSGDDLSAEYTIDLLKRFELTTEEHQNVADYCRNKGILYLCTPWDEKSIAILEKLQVPAFKVASADLTNLPLLEALAKTKKPLLLSTGMSTEEEIRYVHNFLEKRNVQFAFLHCNSTYPAPFHGINLNFIQKLKTIHPLVGYSGHERGTSVSIAAVALGAKIIERHFTLDRTMEGPDHAASLETEDFKNLVTGIRELEQALGEKDRRIVSQGEMINRENLGKSLVSTRALSKGTTLKSEDIAVKSPGQGLSPLFLEQLIGKTLTRDMSSEDYFFQSDLSGTNKQAKSYKFNRPWGIPVRYHDFKPFMTGLDADLVEFHLSYSDMDLNVNDFFSEPQPYGFVVHAPELFKGSHLMDLASPDADYREFSKQETQRVINITRELKKFFPKTKKPLIVANIGGFSMDGVLPPALKEQYYERFHKSLLELDTGGVEIIPQTMAPFPWHFGGQRFQNLFVHPNEIAQKCEQYGLRICLDISHSCLTANHFGYNFEEFLNIVGPYVAHLHLGDSLGVDGEGLQVGDGQIDFKMVSRVLNKTCPSASFIPEIWQGHKNSGAGFWVALERLEGVL